MEKTNKLLIATYKDRTHDTHNKHLKLYSNSEFEKHSFSN
jgi:hypothetical protein